VNRAAEITNLPTELLWVRTRSRRSWRAALPRAAGAFLQTNTVMAEQLYRSRGGAG
jgi:hypothetical protein